MTGTPPRGQLLVIAKAPEPGRVKTRLCPPCTPGQAARLAAASLADTLAAVRATPARRRVLVVAGTLAAVPAGLDLLPQRGDGLAERLAAAFLDTALAGEPSFLIGMDTPQVTAGGLAVALRRLRDADAVLGLAEDGGWWGLGLRDPRHADALRGVPMSTAETGARTFAALAARGLRIAALPVLRDVDTFADARAVAALAPKTRFAAVMARFGLPSAASPANPVAG
jgi:rSAM/selenodomain-associated transferase 1